MGASCGLLCIWLRHWICRWCWGLQREDSIG